MANLHAILSYHDLKQKRANGGGLSDGNIVAIRRDLSSQKVVIQPPPGKAWQATPHLNFEECENQLVFNFDTVVTANIAMKLVLPDGTEIEDTTTVLPESFGEGVSELWGENGIILTHDMRLELQLTGPFPTKRVLFAAVVTEFDLPKQ